MSRANSGAAHFDSGELLAGALPREQARLVPAWIESTSELAAAWRMAINAVRPGRIAPSPTRTVTRRN